MRILIVDLNNFSRYPTMSVGYLTAILRESGQSVEVLSPFALGVPSYPRVMRPHPWGHIDQAIRFWTGTTRAPFVRPLRSALVKKLRPADSSNHSLILGATKDHIEAGIDVILISAYTMYFKLCTEICMMAKTENIPVVVGGNYFAQPEVVSKWLTIDGLTAIFSGEPEPYISDLVQKSVDGGSLASLPGVSVSGGIIAAPAPPLQVLDGLPFPDYRDFPWDKYPNKIIPMMTGRGCGWGACKFCGDVVTSAGRSYRSRSAQDVLEEMKFQHSRHNARLFNFLDLKLNSDKSVWHTLADQAQTVVPGARWTAQVHVDARSDDGLNAADLKAANAGGLVRMTTGFESASRRMLQLMSKGTDPDKTSAVLHYANEAGINVRMTMIIGYPGEEPEDVLESAEFLSKHSHLVDRIVLNRLSLMIGTSLHRLIEKRPMQFPAISGMELDVDNAKVRHWNETFNSFSYRKAVWKLIKTVHKINRKPLTNYSVDFEGVM